MSLRKIEDEQHCCTYYVEPAYEGGDDDSNRRRLRSLELVHVEAEDSQGAITHLEGDDVAPFVSRVWELIRQDDAVLEALEQPLSACEAVSDSVSHLHRMRELRQRLKLRRSLQQDVG